MRLSHKALGGLEVYTEGDHTYVSATEVVSVLAPDGYLDLVRGEVRLALGAQLVLALQRDYRIVGKPEFREVRAPTASVTVHYPYLPGSWASEHGLIEMRGRCEVAKP